MGTRKREPTVFVRTPFEIACSDAAKCAKKCRADVPSLMDAQRVTVFVDDYTWQHFTKQCARLGKEPEQVIRNELLRFTRHEIMMQAWRDEWPTPPEKGAKTA